MLDWLTQKGLVNGDNIQFGITRMDVLTGGVYSVTVSAPLEWFISKFGSETPTSAASLKAKDPTNALGWHKHFDAWAAQGILPAE